MEEEKQFYPSNSSTSDEVNVFGMDIENNSEAKTLHSEKDKSETDKNTNTIMVNVEATSSSDCNNLNVNKVETNETINNIQNVEESPSGTLLNIKDNEESNKHNMVKDVQPSILTDPKILNNSDVEMTENNIPEEIIEIPLSLMNENEVEMDEDNEILIEIVVDEGQDNITEENVQASCSSDLIENVNEDETIDETQTENIDGKSSADQHNPLENWTKEEKFFLYLGIKYRGSRNLEEIREKVQTKSTREIMEAIAYYKEIASKSPECTRRKAKMRKVKTMPTIPLASWAKVLTDNYSFNELQTELVSAFRLIADLDDIPQSCYTDQIDFRNIYHQIANAMEGKSLQHQRLVTEILHSCILETAILSKKFIKVSTFKNIISSINFKEKDMGVFPRPTKYCELTLVRQLASQYNYNPLGLPEESLMANFN